MNPIKFSIKWGIAVCFAVVLFPSGTIQGQTDEFDFEDAPSSINEDNDDRMRKSEEENSRNQNHYYSSPGAGVGGHSNEDGANPPEPGDDPGAPIDGGLSLLLAAGAGYGLKRSRDKRNAKK